MMELQQAQNILIPSLSWHPPLFLRGIKSSKAPFPDPFAAELQVSAYF